MTEHKYNKMLNKAFVQALQNEAIRFVDIKMDFIVMKNTMISYLERRDYDVDEEEIEEFIKEKFNEINEMVKNFSYGDKMMF